MEVHGSPVSAVGVRKGLSNSAVAEEKRKEVVEHTSGQGEEAIKDIVCGSTAGVVGKYIEYPFDTVKVRLQSQPDTVPLRYTGPLDCFKKSLQRDGFLGIYRGISAPLVGAAVETSTLFFSVSLTLMIRSTKYANDCSIALHAMP
jgi:ornithine carrier protein